MRILVMSLPDLRKIYPQRPHQFLKHLSKSNEITAFCVNAWWLGAKQDSYLDDCLKNVDIRYPSHIRIHPALQSLTMTRETIRSIRREGKQYDAILSFNEIVTSVAVSKTMEVPLVLDICDDIPDYVGSSLRVPYLLEPLVRSVARLALDRATRQSAMVTYTLPSIRKKSQIPNSKSVLISNGIDSELFRNCIGLERDLQGISKDDFVVGFVGFIGEWIDFKKPMVAIKRLIGKGFKLKMLIVGSGSRLQEVKNQASELGISDSVITVGNVPYHEIPQYISYMDACLLPFARTPTSENALPLKLFEYMACGKAVISTKTKGVFETVGDLALYSDTVDEYVCQIRKLVRFGQSAQRSREAMELVREKHDWRKISEKVEETLARVVESNVR